MSYSKTRIHSNSPSQFAWDVFNELVKHYSITLYSRSGNLYNIPGSSFGNRSMFSSKKTGGYLPNTITISGSPLFLSKDWYDTSTKGRLCIYDNLKDFVSSLTSKRFMVQDDSAIRGDKYVLYEDESIPYSSTASSGGPSLTRSSPKLDKLPLNLILYGPPGTGKTYNTIYKTLDILKEPVVCVSGVTKSHETWYNNDKADRDKALEKFNDLKKNGRVVFTTFHQSMSYEDFIEGIKPILDGKSVGYEIKPGIFKQISKIAADDPENNYVLIIDEINRGNVANIFGELITLIEEDKRLGNSEQMTCTLPYSKDIFGVPNNLYIIGTMNTADRSVEALDSALRRRFTFEEMMPKPELWEKEPVVDGVNLQEFLTVINRRISLLKDREHQIGHSYLIKVKNKEELIDVIFKNVIPLLQEYFYGDYEKIQMVLGKTFIPEDKDTFNVAFATTDSFDKPEKVFRIARKDEVVTDIDSALESIKFGFEKAHAEPTEEPEHAE